MQGCPPTSFQRNLTFTPVPSPLLRSDAYTLENRGFGVESVADVWERALEGLEKVEGRAGGERTCVVIVGHADTLQIMQAGRHGEEEMKRFSEFRMANAEARLLDAELPTPVKMEPPGRSGSNA